MQEVWPDCPNSLSARCREYIGPDMVHTTSAGADKLAERAFAFLREASCRRSLQRVRNDSRDRNERRDRE